jgi:hypothetical protein
LETGIARCKSGVPDQKQLFVGASGLSLKAYGTMASNGWQLLNNLWSPLGIDFILYQSRST